MKFSDNYDGATPLVSIILVAHEGDAKYLPRALGSIAAQDLDPSSMEVLIAFDGDPSEQAWAYIEDAPRPHCPVQVLGTKDHTGYYTIPRNRATAFARGLYIYNMDADNEIAPTHLSGLLAAIRVPDPQEGWPHFVYSRREYIKDPECSREVPVGSSPLVPWTPENCSALPQKNFLDTGDVLIGKSVLYELAERTGFIWNTELRRFADWDLAVRLMKNGFRGKAVDQITNLYHWTGGNLQLTRALSDMVVIPESMYEELKKRGQVIG